MSPFRWFDSGGFVDRLEELLDGDFSSNSALSQHANAVLDSVEASVAVVGCGMRKLCEELIQDLLLPHADEESCREASPPPTPNKAEQLHQIQSHRREETESGVWGEMGLPSTLLLQEGLQGEECKGGAGAEEHVRESIEEGGCVGVEANAEENIPEIEGYCRSALSRGCCMAASLMADPHGKEGQAYWYTSPKSRGQLRVEEEEVEEGWVVV